MGAGWLPEPIQTSESMMITVKVRNLVFGNVSLMKLTAARAAHLGLSDGDELTPSHALRLIAIGFQEIGAGVSIALTRR